MFSATITGKIKRVLHDNEKDGKDAMIKVVVETRKQYVKDGDMPNVYPAVAVFGYDAAYLRDYAGVGHWAHFFNCDMDVYRPDDADEDRISFKANKIEILPKAMAEAVADTIEEEDDDEDRGRRKKKKGSKSSSKRKPRSERRKKRSRDDDDDYDDYDEDDEDLDDDDDDEEEERPRKKKSSRSSSSKKKPAKKKKRKDDDDEDDDEDDYDDDDDEDYFDE